MNPLDFLEPEELLKFFHCHKTEMSCMENPHIFLRQLRDHNLIPEDVYQKVSRMKSKDNKQRGVYNILDWLETERSQHIEVFWRCAFKETIMNFYPFLRMLRHSLMDGSYKTDMQLPERLEEMDEGKRKELPEEEEGEGEEEKQANSVKKKRKRKSRSSCDNDEEEQAGPSSELTPAQKKRSKKIPLYSPLKKGVKCSFWTWPIYKIQLPVTCGQQEGILNRDRLAKGQKCIVVAKKWFTPTEFEKFSGKENYKNWKLSIRCMGTSLGKLLKEGHLKSVRYKRGCNKAKKYLFTSAHTVAVSEGEEEEEEEEVDEGEDEGFDQEDQFSSSSKDSSTEGDDGETEEQQPEASHGGSKKVFKVTCGDIAGTLHEKRFASGTCGKSIRTETSWMTPVEFLEAASSPADANWRRDIKWDGKPLSVLTEANILTLHLLLCSCKLCKPDSTDLENQKNDDECYICKSADEEEGDLVECDHCPCSFHQNCHLPHVEEVILGDPRPWMCTFCVFKIYQELSYRDQVEREAATSSQTSQRMLQCQYLLLSLWSADEEHTFTMNPCLYIKDYSAMIKTPMWLGKVTDKLLKGCYQTVGDFESDIQLIFTNCASYNRDNAEFLAQGNRLKKLFDEEFKNVFKIRE